MQASLDAALVRVRQLEDALAASHADTARLRHEGRTLVERHSRLRSSALQLDAFRKVGVCARAPGCLGHGRALS
jgi:hypothetical protein